MTNEELINFYNEIVPVVGEDWKIIVEPGKNDLNEDWLEYDSVKWEMEECVSELVNKIENDKTLTFEDKMLKVYDLIAKHYIYDDNVLFFFKKRFDEEGNPYFIAVDFYGRIVKHDWIENRQAHNRRVCYEFARFFAPAINKLLGNNEELEACMVGDKGNNHYVVGLTGKKYNALLDVDDFNKIKDLTRIKLGLTMQGITIIRDEENILRQAVEKYNEGREVDLPEVIKIDNKKAEYDFIEYINKIIDIIKPYNLDPQGFMEYMRQKIESDEMPVDKIWRKITGGKELRHVRCLVFEYNSKKYLLDSVDQLVKEIDLDKLDENMYVIDAEANEYMYYGG